MSTERWRFEEINQISNRDFILRVLDERRKDLTPGSPLGEKCKRAKRWLEKAVPVDGTKDPPVSSPSAPATPSTARVTPIVTGKGQAQLIPGKDIKLPTTREPSNHRAAMHYTPKQKVEILTSYLARGDGTKGHGPHGKWLYREEDIFKNHNATSGGMNRIIWEYGPGGELFRVPRRKQLILKGIATETKPPLATPETPIRPEVERTSFLVATTEASKFWFEKSRRKRWNNVFQKEVWENCESDVGSVNMREAAAWALTKNITNINSIITRALQIKRTYGYRQ